MTNSELGRKGGLTTQKIKRLEESNKTLNQMLQSSEKVAKFWESEFTLMYYKYHNDLKENLK